MSVRKANQINSLSLSLSLSVADIKLCPLNQQHHTLFANGKSNANNKLLSKEKFKNSCISFNVISIHLFSSAEGSAYSFATLEMLAVSFVLITLICTSFHHPPQWLTTSGCGNIGQKFYSLAICYQLKNLAQTRSVSNDTTATTKRLEGDTCGVHLQCVACRTSHFIELPCQTSFCLFLHFFLLVCFQWLSTLLPLMCVILVVYCKTCVC